MKRRPGGEVCRLTYRARPLQSVPVNPTHAIAGAPDRRVQCSHEHSSLSSPCVQLGGLTESWLRCCSGVGKRILRRADARRAQGREQALCEEGDRLALQVQQFIRVVQILELENERLRQSSKHPVFRTLPRC